MIDLMRNRLLLLTIHYFFNLEVVFSPTIDIRQGFSEPLCQLPFTTSAANELFRLDFYSKQHLLDLDERLGHIMLQNCLCMVQGEDFEPSGLKSCEHRLTRSSVTRLYAGYSINRPIRDRSPKFIQMRKARPTMLRSGTNPQ